MMPRSLQSFYYKLKSLLKNIKLVVLQQLDKNGFQEHVRLYQTFFYFFFILKNKKNYLFQINGVVKKKNNLSPFVAILFLSVSHHFNSLSLPLNKTIFAGRPDFAIMVSKAGYCDVFQIFKYLRSQQKKLQISTKQCLT